MLLRASGDQRLYTSTAAPVGRGADGVDAMA
jgi:hypothetical protein